MELIRHIILFCYMFAIFFGIAGITIVFLAGRRRETGLNRALKLFMGCMLVMSLYDMLIYYTDYIIGGISGGLVLRIGNCIMALLFYCWLNLQQKLLGSEAFQPFNKTAKRYIFSYAALWFICTITLSLKFFYTLKWLLLVTDIILLLVMLVGSVVYIGEAVWTRQKKELVYYMVIVTAMLIWNFASYFWGETSVYWGNSKFIREPLDLTIIFWFVVNILTLLLIYRRDFKTAYKEDQGSKEFDLGERLLELSAEYDLTARERDLVRLIYEGKSNNEIAQELFIAESTVKTHVYNIFRKLGVKNRIGVTCVIRGESRDVKDEK